MTPPPVDIILAATPQVGGMGCKRGDGNGECSYQQSYSKPQTSLDGVTEHNVTVTVSTYTPYAQLAGYSALPTRVIPGVGERTSDQDPSKPACGTVRAWVGCSTNKEHRKTPHKYCCNNVECPECWQGWAAKQARITSEKLIGYITAARPDRAKEQSTFGYRKEEEEQCFAYTDFQSVVDFLDGKRESVYHWSVGHWKNAQQLRHFVLSMEPGSVTPDMPQERIHAIGKFWCRWVGIRGGMMVFHPFRILPEVKERLNTLVTRAYHDSEEDYEKKHWNAIRDSETWKILGIPAWTDAVYWSPHFHIAGFGFVCNSMNFNKLTGHVVVEVRNVSARKDWDGQWMNDDYAALAYYMLSHACVMWGKKSVIWVGCMTPTNLKRMPEKPEVGVYQRVCPDCQSDQVEYACTLDGDLGEVTLVLHGENAGQVRYSIYVEKLYRYHIVTGREKDAKREQRRAERLRSKDTSQLHQRIPDSPVFKREKTAFF